ncbi:MAG: DUF975 family protein [Clostridia bacterium]|nr:DUF975 family protein [Clostridia bacterium]
MWTRCELKAKAKEVLKYSYWMSFVVCLLVGVVSGRDGSLGRSISKFEGSATHSNFDVHHLDTILPFMNFAIILAIIIIISLAIAFAFFVSNPIIVGSKKFFIQAANRDVQLNYIGYGFKSNYMNGVKTMFVMDLLIFLWSLLFVIPGIVKSYSYMMVPYILAENPNISRQRAFEISIRATEGHKWNMWVLDLSFIGWYVLGIAACFIGVLFVRPYYYATHTQLYLKLRNNAILNGITTENELSGMYY